MCRVDVVHALLGAIDCGHASPFGGRSDFYRKGRCGNGDSSTVGTCYGPHFEPYGPFMGLEWHVQQNCCTCISVSDLSFPWRLHCCNPVFDWSSERCLNCPASLCVCIVSPSQDAQGSDC